MGKFVSELKRRGAFLYGSRALGVATPDSDYDWALLETADNLRFLTEHGFTRDGTHNGRDGIHSGRMDERPANWCAILDLFEFRGEAMVSYRLYQTNVVLMSSMLLEATRYATEMLKAYEGKGLVRTKAGRIQGYQLHSIEFANMYGR